MRSCRLASFRTGFAPHRRAGQGSSAVCNVPWARVDTVPSSQQEEERREGRTLSPANPLLDTGWLLIYLQLNCLHLNYSCTIRPCFP